MAGFKIGSGEANHVPLIRHIASFGKPVILSTGMQTIESLRPSVQALDDAGIEYALLECTNLYPSPPEIVSLQGITELRNAFPRAVIGFSDHSIGPEMALSAVALGACQVALLGTAGFIGTLAIGTLLQRGLYGPLITIPIVMSVIALALIPLGAWVLPVTGLLGVWGLIATASPVGWWNWTAQAMPHDAEIGGGLMVAIIQLAIALGSTIGGALFDASGYQSTCIASAVMLLIGAFLTFQTSRAQVGQGT